ncbi:MAG: hypothetical protein ACP5KV_04360 [Candidatus Methanomethylicaceae archaeon]
MPPLEDLWRLIKKDIEDDDEHQSAEFMLLDPPYKKMLRMRNPPLKDQRPYRIYGEIQRVMFLSLRMKI